MEILNFSNGKKKPPEAITTIETTTRNFKSSNKPIYNEEEINFFKFHRNHQKDDDDGENDDEQQHRHQHQHHHHHHHHHHQQQQQQQQYSYYQQQQQQYQQHHRQHDQPNYFQLKDKFQINKIIHVAAYVDDQSRRILYLSLLVLIFSCVLIRVATATGMPTEATTTTTTTTPSPSPSPSSQLSSTKSSFETITDDYSFNNSSSTNDNNYNTNDRLQLNNFNLSNDPTIIVMETTMTTMMMTTMETTTMATNRRNDGMSSSSTDYLSDGTTVKPILLITTATTETTATATNGDDFNANAEYIGVATIAADAVETYKRTVRDASNVPDDDDDSSYHDDEIDEYDALINNKSAKGKYIGAPCNDLKCEPTLLHVSCDKETNLCDCEKNYPVVLGLTRGCDKPKKLGEQCFYDETCLYNDENSLCIQVRHNALCQCANGFHSVTYSKPTRRVFCTQDIAELTSDLPTLLGVSTGIAVLAGLMCMVLHLISKTKYPRHRNFGDANLPPPIMYSSDTGIPLTVQSGRPSSRSSVRSSGSIGSYGNRRSSSTIQSGATATAGSKGILVSTSRTGSRRPSLASVHSTSSSVRSYSMMRFEKETQQREIRQEMKLRLARLQQQQHMSQNKPQIVIGDAASVHHGAIARVCVPTPSPLTPNSMDELLPAVDETQEFPLKPEQPSTSSAACVTMTTATIVEPITTAAYNGPCSSSTEAL